jgi:hypothetical protein
MVALRMTCPFSLRPAAAAAARSTVHGRSLATKKQAANAKIGTAGGGAIGLQTLSTAI